MRRTREVKAETHEAILAKASRLFRERGIEGASLGDVMSEAGLTHGGFYRHFKTKDELVAAAVRATFAGLAQAVEERAATTGLPQAVKEYFDDYLTERHVAHPGHGCPIPALAGEISRAPETVRAEFSAGFNDSLATLAKGMPGPETEQREAALRALALRVGAVVIARASDPDTARDVLEACRNGEKS